MWVLGEKFWCCLISEALITNYLIPGYLEQVLEAQWLGIIEKWWQKHIQLHFLMTFSLLSRSSLLKLPVATQLWTLTKKCAIIHFKKKISKCLCRSVKVIYSLFQFHWKMIFYWIHFSLWLDGVFPLVMDRETTAQEKCFQILDEVLLSNIAPQSKLVKWEKDKLPQKVSLCCPWFSSFYLLQIAYWNILHSEFLLVIIN